MKNMRKLDGSFNIVVNGMPYNTTQGDKYFEETQNLYLSNPELFEEEKNVIPAELNYADKRLAEYPSITEQLDMIYWDKINGTDNWFSVISEIKSRYPKV